jgi:ubiquinone/menaquinone biosynthesis C-methylase UbiE
MTTIQLERYTFSKENPMSISAPPSAELLEKIRKQFDFGPYPRIPLEQTPKDEINNLFIHNLVTPYYLRHQRVVDTKDKVILDAGCGSGYKCLLLAEANPGAKIVGIDISPASVDMARERLNYHNIENAEFHAMLLEDLPSLGLQFDYINCDEVLYLLPDPIAGLQAMQAVLTPEGILRTNLHSSLQRAVYYRAQAVFKQMGLMDSNPEEFEMNLVREVMQSLHDNVNLKSNSWRPEFNQSSTLSTETLLANHLLQGDKGSTIPEFFEYMRAAQLEFISMTQWHRWSLLSLFKQPDNLPPFLAMSLPELEPEQELHLYELLHPTNRLLDLWCGHEGVMPDITPVGDWQPDDWRQATAHLHPQLCRPQVKESLLEFIRDQKVVDLGIFLSATTNKPVYVDRLLAACLLPLFAGPQSVLALAERWRQLQPCDLVTLELFTIDAALSEISKLLRRLEIDLFVMLEKA